MSNIKELEEKVSCLEVKVRKLESIIEQFIDKEAFHEPDDSLETENNTDTSSDHSKCLSRGFCKHGYTSSEEKTRNGK